MAGRQCTNVTDKTWCLHGKHRVRSVVMSSWETSVALSGHVAIGNIGCDQIHVADTRKTSAEERGVSDMLPY